MHRHIRPALRWMGIPAVAAATLFPGLRAGPSLDAGVFGLVGRQIASGAVPYVEAWDHKPPGIHLVHAFADILPVLDPWGWTWLLTLLSTSAASWLLVSILRPFVAAPVAVAAGLVSALGFGHFLLSLGGGLSESFAVFAATGALAVAVRRDLSIRRALLPGLLVGLAVLISPQLAPAGVGVLLVLVGSGSLAVMTYLAGAAFPALILLAGLAVGGALPAFVEALVTYNAAYRDTVGPGLALLPWIVLVLVGLIAPALVGAFALRRSSAATRRLGLAALAWIIVAVGLVVVQGRLYGHYAIGPVVPLAILAAIGLQDVLARLRARPVRVAAAGIGAGLVALSLVVGAAAARMELAMIEAVNVRASAVSAWAADEDLRDEPMLVWGNAPQAYLFNGSPLVTRYGFLYPLATPGYANEVMIDAELARLEASPPTFVVDAGSLAPGEPGFLPLLIDRPVATDGRDLDLLDPLRDFVTERYELVETVGGWPVYRLDAEGSD